MGDHSGFDCAMIPGMPVVCDNPQLWMVKIFDGFGVHLNNLQEGGDSLLFTQSYDREAAKSDKNVQCMNLSYL